MIFLRAEKRLELMRSFLSREFLSSQSELKDVDLQGWHKRATMKGRNVHYLLHDLNSRKYTG